MNDLLPMAESILPASSTDRFCAEQAEAIRVLGRRVVGDIIEIGNRLIAVKGRLQHGEWLPWLEREFGWSERGAQNYIAVANAFSGKSATVADLPIDAGALYLLAGPTVPEPAREKAVERAEQGDRITKAEAEKLIRVAREQAHQEEEETRTKLAKEIERLNARIAGLNSAVEHSADASNEAVAEATSKLRKQIEKLQDERNGALESLKKLRTSQREPAVQRPAIDGTKSFRSMCIMQGIEALHKELRISAADAVSVHFESCTLTTEKPAARLGPASRQAREIVAWLNDFIAEFDKR
jgi:hypothetical protein